MFAQLTSGVDFHSKALVLRAERQRIIASNIANADTPGYVARDINFKEALTQMTQTSASELSGSGVRLSHGASGVQVATANTLPWAAWGPAKWQVGPRWLTPSRASPVWTATVLTWTGNGPTLSTTRFVMRPPCALSTAAPRAS